MLHIFFDKPKNLLAREDFIKYPMDYFNYSWETAWLEDSFGRSVIQSIDKVELGEDVVASLLSAGMRVEDLCTGTKNLLLCKHIDDKMHRLSMMGGNCYKFLMDVAEEKELYMGAENTFYFKDSDLLGRTVHFVNFNTYASTAREFALQMYDAKGGGPLG